MEIDDYVIELVIIQQATMTITELTEGEIFASIKLPGAKEEVIVHFPEKEFYHIVNGRIAISRKAFKIGDHVLCKKVIEENAIRISEIITNPPQSPIQADGLREGFSAGDLCCIFTIPGDGDVEGCGSSFQVNFLFYKPEEVQNITFLGFIRERLEEFRKFDQLRASDQLMIENFDGGDPDMLDNVKAFIERVNEKFGKDRPGTSSGTGSG